MGPLWPFLAVLTSLWRAVTFDPRKIWKIWAQIWNQRSSNILKSVNSKFLTQAKKSSFFPLHVSSSSFNFSKIILSIKIFCKKIIFPTYSINRCREKFKKAFHFSLILLRFWRKKTNTKYCAFENLWISFQRYQVYYDWKTPWEVTDKTKKDCTLILNRL